MLRAGHAPLGGHVRSYQRGLSLRCGLSKSRVCPIHVHMNRRYSIDEQLRFAIANKRLIQVSYREKVRVAEPHDYGVYIGIPRLLTYQLRVVAAGQRTGARGWRLLDVPDIAGCAVLDDTFPGSRGQMHQHHLKWDVLYARVS